jgi:hypothetical protein
VNRATDYPFDRFRRLQLTGALQSAAGWEPRGSMPDFHLPAAAAEVAWFWRAVTPLGRVTVTAAGALAAAAVYGGVKFLRRRVQAS